MGTSRARVAATQPGTQAATLVLPDEREAPRRARRFAAESLTGAGLGDMTDDACTVVTELVTNALLHAGFPAELVIRIAPPGRVRIEVTDGSREWPVRGLLSADAMTGRGLGLIEALADDWGVETSREGKVVWAELRRGGRSAAPERSEDELLAMWGPDGDVAPDDARVEPRFMVRLGDVPTDLLLSAKAHVDNLVREFTLAASGARTGATAAVPPQLAELIDTVVNRFAEPRQEIRRQALAAARAGEDHVRLELRLPLAAANAGELYLRALDEADAYCRASRLLTLESPPQHRIFRRWYIEELIGQLRRAAAGGPHVPPGTFEQRLLAEIDAVAAAERSAERAARLHVLSAALAGALTPEAVAEAVLTEGVAALGAAGGGLLLPADAPTLAVPGTVGYDERLVAELRGESRDAALPAAVALRTSLPVWLESRQERDQRFPGLASLEPATAALCAVPLTVGERCLGALRFSFSEPQLFDDDIRSFVLAMAAHTAQALDRAQLYEQRVDAARRMQRNLLPRRLPTVPGVTITTAHHPLSDGLVVGGDFYDLWPSGPDRWAVAIGDAAGTGPEAAAMTALVRHTLRALTTTGLDVDNTLTQVHRALVEDSGGEVERYCTMMLGLLDVSAGACRLELASGGHPGPVVLRVDGTVEEIELRGSLLGVLDTLTVDRRVVTLQPGDEVVLFTDGVTQARDGGTFFGVGGIVRAAAVARAQRTSTAAEVQRAVLRHGGGRVRDDLAVLALRFDGPEPGGPPVARSGPAA